MADPLNCVLYPTPTVTVKAITHSESWISTDENLPQQELNFSQIVRSGVYTVEYELEVSIYDFEPPHTLTPKSQITWTNDCEIQLSDELTAVTVTFPSPIFTSEKVDIQSFTGPA